MATTACAVWDFRANQNLFDENELIKWMQSNCTNYTFQLEIGDSGYIHWQGRFRLIKKRIKSVVVKLFKDKIPHYLEPTEKSNHLKEFFYAQKEDTRLRGPWRDSDTSDEKYIPKHLRNIILRPWQQQIIDSRDTFNDRQINMIYDPVGNNGKSTLASIAELKYGGLDMPPLNDFKELIGLLCNICMDRNLRQVSPLFFDLPRAIDKTRLYGLYSAIEQTKKGKLYDTRYHYKEWWIDSPNIWVFSNIPPDINLLSKDRWIIWTIKDQQLVKWEPEPIQEVAEKINPLDII